MLLLLLLGGGGTATCVVVVVLAVWLVDEVGGAAWEVVELEALGVVPAGIAAAIPTNRRESHFMLKGMTNVSQGECKDNALRSTDSCFSVALEAASCRSAPGETQFYSSHGSSSIRPIPIRELNVPADAAIIFRGEHLTVEEDYNINSRLPLVVIFRCQADPHAVFR